MVFFDLSPRFETRYRRAFALSLSPYLDYASLLSNHHLQSYKPAQVRRTWGSHEAQQGVHEETRACNSFQIKT